MNCSAGKCFCFVFFFFKPMGLLLVLLFLTCAFGQIQELSSWRMIPASGLDPASTSNPSFDDSSWTPCTVPTTVFGAVAPPDIFKGLNLNMINASSYQQPYLFRTLFFTKGYTGVLRFHSISYRGRVFINGVQVTKDDLVGTFVSHDVLVTSTQVGANGLTVEVWPGIDDVFPLDTTSLDLSITWIDWSPSPPDRSMGLIRKVLFVANAHAILENPTLNTILNVTSNSAVVTVSADVFNIGQVAFSGVAKMSLLGQSAFGKVSFTQPGQRTLVTFSSITITNVSNVLWWPWTHGTPNLQQLVLAFQDETATFNVGIRQVESVVNAKGYRSYSINKVPFLVRGAGWASELFLRDTPDRIMMGLTYAKNMGLNTIRLEGMFPEDLLFDAADEMGMFIIPGISCCDAWQRWNMWNATTLSIATNSIRSQVKRVRQHACCLAFWYSSDELPPANVEQAYLDVFSQEKWPNALLASASAYTSPLSGPTGVKMSGPYAWVPPVYWFQGAEEKKLGGAFGFLTEGGPGASVMLYYSLKQYVEDLWPPTNDDWNYHAANPRGLFHDLRFDLPQLNARYGPANDAESLARKFQIQTYEAYRAFFEAYNLYRVQDATGLISWMLQNGRPQNYWNLFQYDGGTGGSFYGVKMANRPVHVILNPSDYSISLSNSLQMPLQQVAVTARLFSAQGKLLWNSSVSVGSIAMDSVVHIAQLKIPLISPSTLRFVQLECDHCVTRNTYWLAPESTKDVLVWKKSNFYRTQCSSYANYTEINHLPQATQVTMNTLIPASCNGYACQMQFQVSNGGNTTAFFIHLRLMSTSDEIYGLWDNNFFTLFPGQDETVTVRFTSNSTQNLSGLAIPFNQ